MKFYLIEASMFCHGSYGGT